jgi:hypothetical protein
MHVEPESVRDGGLTRRQLLTRGAIAGGLVWAAPVIRTTAAYATTANGTERPCIDFYMVVIGPSGQVRPAPGNTDAASVPPAIRQWFRDNPSVEVRFPGVTPQLTSNTSDVWAVLLPEVTGPNASGRQCRMVLGWGRAGNSFAEGYVDPNPPIAVETGRRLLFPCPAGGGHHGGGDGGGDGGHHGGDGGGGDHNGDGDDNGCANGHDDGDHDADDLGCDPSAVDSAGGLTGTGTADATTTTTPPGAVGLSASSIGSDGSGSTAIGSDGSTSTPISADGSQSHKDGGGGDGGHGSGACLDAIFLVYCCPR